MAYKPNPVTLTTDVTGVLPLANGGTSANLTASNGGIFYSTATTGAILSGTATAGQILRSGASTTPGWSTATYPATAGTSGKVLISDGTNIVSSTPTYPNSASGTGTFLRADGTNWVASTSTLPNTNSQGDLLYGSASNVWTSLSKDTNSTRYLSNQGSSNSPSWNQVNLANGVTGVLPAANGGWGQIVTNYGITGSSTTSGSYVDVTSASASITPVSSSNRILVTFCFASLAAIGTGTNPIHYQQIVRDSTVITGSESMINSGQNSTGTVGVYTFISMTLLDSPATTSSTTYKLQHKVNIAKSCTSQNIYITLIEVSS